MSALDYVVPQERNNDDTEEKKETARRKTVEERRRNFEQEQVSFFYNTEKCLILNKIEYDHISYYSCKDEETIA